MLWHFATAMIPIWIVEAFIHVRFIGVSSALPVSLTVLTTAVISTLILASPWICGGKLAGNPYWLLVSVISINFMCFIVIGIIGSVYGGLRVITGLQYVLIAGIGMIAVSRGGLHPLKAW